MPRHAAMPRALHHHVATHPTCSLLCFCSGSTWPAHLPRLPTQILMDLDLEERGTVPHYLAYKQAHLSADEASQLEQKLATKFPHREVDGDAVYVWRDV